MADAPEKKDKKPKKDKKDKKRGDEDEGGASAASGSPLSPRASSAAIQSVSDMVDRLPLKLADGEVEDFDRNRVVVEAVCSLSFNSVCADCNSQGTRWASVNHGVFVCIRCSGIHRSLGAHISKVKSTNMDKWTAAEIRVIFAIGNIRQKELFEARLPRGTKKPEMSDTDPVVRSYITQKYADKAFAVENIAEVLKKTFKVAGYKSGVKALKEAAESSGAAASGRKDGEKSASPLDKGSKKAKAIFGVFGQVTVAIDQHDELRRVLMAHFGVEEAAAAAA